MPWAFWLFLGVLHYFFCLGDPMKLFFVVSDEEASMQLKNEHLRHFSSNQLANSDILSITPGANEGAPENDLVFKNDSSKLDEILTRCIRKYVLHILKVSAKSTNVPPNASNFRGGIDKWYTLYMPNFEVITLTKKKLWAFPNAQ